MSFNKLKDLWDEIQKIIMPLLIISSLMYFFYPALSSVIINPIWLCLCIVIIGYFLKNKKFTGIILLFIVELFMISYDFNYYYNNLHKLLYYLIPFIVLILTYRYSDIINNFLNSYLYEAIILKYSCIIFLIEIITIMLLAIVLPKFGIYDSESNLYINKICLGIIIGFILRSIKVPKIPIIILLVTLLLFDIYISIGYNTSYIYHLDSILLILTLILPIQWPSKKHSI